MKLATQTPTQQNDPKRRSPGAVLQFRKVLVPVDFSKNSRAALSYAVKFASQHNSQLILVHVVEPMLYPSGVGYPSLAMLPLPEAYKGKAKKELQKLKEEEVRPGMKVDAKMRVGRPYVEITKAARELDVDLIIIATHGYTGWKHVLLGSTAERVVQRATCPVLTVRTRGK